MAIAIDNLGRKIDTANMTLSDIKSLIGSLMQSKVGDAKPMQPATANSGPIDELKNLFEQYTKDFKTEVDEQKTLLQQVVDNLKEISGLKEAKKSTDSGGNKSDKFSQGMFTETQKLANIFGKKGSGYVHDIYVEAKLSTIIKMMHKMMGRKAGPMSKYEVKPDPALIEKFNEGLTKVETPPPPPTPDLSDAEKRVQELNKELRFTREEAAIASFLANEKWTAEQIKGMTRASRAFTKLLPIIKSITKTFNDTFLGYNPMETMFKNALKGEREFIQGMDKILYQQKGITGDTPELQKQFEKLGTTVERTGVNRDAYQKSYMGLLKKGMTDQKKAKDITVAQLQAEKQVGMEVGTLGPMFADLALHGKLTADEISNVAAGIKEAARNTGLVGSELAQAVESSKQYMNNMMKSGQFNADGAKNIIAMQAALQKAGVADSMSGVMNALTSGHNLLNESSAETKNLVFGIAGRLGKMQQAVDGTLLKTRKGKEEFAMGMQKALEDIAGVAMEDIDNLGEQQKAQISRVLKAQYGMELGEFKRSAEALRDEAKPLSQKFDEIQKKMKDANTTAQEKIALENQEKKLKQDANARILSSFMESTKGAKNMQEALSKFGKKKDEFNDDLKAMGITATTEAGVLSEVYKNQIASVNADLAKGGQPLVKIDEKRLQKAIKSGNTAELKTIQEELIAGQQRAETAAEAATDPISQNNQLLMKINDSLRIMTGAFITDFLKSTIGRLLIFLSTWASIFLSFIGGFIVLAKNIWSLTSLFEGGPKLGLTLAEGMFGGLRTGLTRGFTGLRTFLTGATLGWAQIIFSVIDGIFGAFRGYANTEKNFKGAKGAEKGVNTEMKVASTAAGGITGVLNGLSLGLLGFLGITEHIEKFISFVLLGALEGLMSALQPIFSAISGIWNSVKGIFSDISDAFAEIFGVFSSGSGEAGGFLELIRGLVSLGTNFTLLFFTPIYWSIYGVAKAVEALVAVFAIFAKMFKAVGQLVGGVLKIIGAVFTGNFREIGTIVTDTINAIGETFYDMIMVLPNLVYRTFQDLVNAIVAPFRWLYDVLVGHSIVPDLVFAIIKFFAMLPINIMKGLLSLPLKIMGFLNGSIFGIFKTIGLAFTSSLSSLGSTIQKTFSNISTRIGKTFKPFTSGFAKDKEQGKGTISALKRGISGQYNSMTKGGSITGKAGGLFGKAKGKAGKLLNAASGMAGGALSMFTGGSESESECGCQAIQEQGSNLVDDATNILSDKLGKKGLLGKAGDIKDSMLNKGKGILDKSKDFGKSVLSKGQGIAKTGFDKSKGLVGNLFGKSGNISSSIGNSMKGSGIMGGLFGKAGGIAKMGLGAGKSLLKKLPFVGAIAGAGFAIAALAQGNIGGAVKELASGIAGAVPIIGPALSMAVDFFGDTIIGGAVSLGKSAWEGAKWLGGKLWEGTKWIGNKLWEGASAVGNFLMEGGKAVWEGAKQMGKKVLDGASAVGNFLWEKTGAKALWDGTKEFRDQVWDGAKNIGNSLLNGAKWLLGYETDAKAEAAAATGAEKATAKTAGTEVATATTATSATVTAAPLQGNTSDLAAAIQTEQIKTEAPKASVSSPELTAIADESSAQTTHLTQLVSLMQEMVNNMQAGSDISTGASETGAASGMNKVTQKPANYFRVPVGMVSQQASKAVLNVGPPRV